MSNEKCRFAILEGKEIIPAIDAITWAKWFEKNYGNRVVGNDHIGDVQVSTVFLGLNHSFFDDTPLWFETMIFGGEHDDYQDRYSTYEEAEAGHKKALELVNASK